ATSIYKNMLPIPEAPIASIFLARVNDNKRPKVVASTTIQKKELVREYVADSGKLTSKKGTSISAAKWARPVIAKATPSNNINSLVPFFLLFCSPATNSILED